MSTTAEGGKLGRCKDPLNMSETQRAWDHGENDWAEENGACAPGSFQRQKLWTSQHDIGCTEQ